VARQTNESPFAKLSKSSDWVSGTTRPIDTTPIPEIVLGIDEAVTAGNERRGAEQPARRAWPTV